jgi:phytoene synthase
MDETLSERGYEQAERITRERAKSFYFASSALGPETKRAAFAVYAFCRRCDDAVDEGPREGLAARVAEVRAQLDDAYRGDPHDDPIVAALAETVRLRAVPREAFDDLILGMEQDLTKTRYRTWEELDAYCQLAAGTVGLMMASVFGVRETGALVHASALGRAMQLTNVLRDVREDLDTHDRVYLPLDALEAGGVREEHLRAFSRRGALDDGPEAEAVRGVMREGARRARELYVQADQGIPSIIPWTGRASVRLMRATYADILNVLEARGHDPFLGRASTSRARKVWVGMGALLGEREVLA